MTTAICTCPDCTTGDFRAVDEMCHDPDCHFGEIDPGCPVHGDDVPPVCLGVRRMDELAAAGFPPADVDGCSDPDCPLCASGAK